MSLPEAFVLLPGSTLEDFPTQLPDDQARGLLAAIAVAHHPSVLARCRTLPQMTRADVPPSPSPETWLWICPASEKRLPDGYLNRARDAGARVFRGTDRVSFEAAAELRHPPSLRSAARAINHRDFYAAAYAKLQVEITTRRLRYTSNLDEIHLQNRLVDAANALTEGDAQYAVDAMHEVFDALAQERDHYFASDPHLIDLTLTTPETLDALIAHGDWTAVASPDTEHGDAPEPCGDSSADRCGPLPDNVLLSEEFLDHLRGNLETPAVQKLVDAINCGSLGVATGGPSDERPLDAMLLTEAEDELARVHRLASEVCGQPPSVYGRLSGHTPSDLLPAIQSLGYRGVVPLDFVGGSGSGEEAKVLLGGESEDIEALTVQPTDAGSDAAFLDLFPKLGEAIDQGEIATALLVHWPGRVCEAMHDLRRAATWGLVFGRFWKLDDYFQRGERPYHHGTLGVVAAVTPTDLAERWVQRSLSEQATDWRDKMRARQTRLLESLTGIAAGGKTIPSDDSTVADEFARGVGQQAAAEGRGMLVAHGGPTGRRVTVFLPGPAPDQAEWIYAATPRDDGHDITVDVPAGGFVTLVPGDGGSIRKTNPLVRWIRRSLVGNAGGPILADNRLQNEFMEAVVDTAAAGVSGVYSGAGRGNRFSSKWVVGGDSIDGPVRNEIADAIGSVVVDDVRALRSDPARGILRCIGRFVIGQKDFAHLETTFTLDRGSRTLRVAGRWTSMDWPLIDARVGPQNEGSSFPRYLGLRVAMPDESASVRFWVRDKFHRHAKRTVTAPGGYWIDDGQRQTVVCGEGLPVHRRIGNRFIDTPVASVGDGEATFSLTLGFDVPHAAAMVQDAVCDPVSVRVAGDNAASSRGFLLRVRGREVTLLGIEPVADQKDQFDLKLLQTKSKSVTAKIDVCRDVEKAWDPRSDVRYSVDGGDSVVVPMSGHASRTVRIKLAAATSDSD